MKLQLALDLISLEESLKLVNILKTHIDIIELGTSFSFANHISVIKDFKKLAPNASILCDFKILDGGKELASLAFENGASIVTVSANTWNETLVQTIETSEKYKGKVMVDFMGVRKEQLVDKIKTIDNLKPDYICFHKAVSVEEDLNYLPQNIYNLVKNSKIAIAGGINCSSLKKVLKYKPDLIIVGSAITNSKDPLNTTIKMRKIMEGFN